VLIALVLCPVLIGLVLIALVMLLRCCPVLIGLVLIAW
jgi:hypothetical protein